MSNDFPFVKIPEQFAAIIGERDGETHVYRREGPQEEIGPWFELLTDLVGGTVSPGGVGMFCPVSRASVHESVKRGKLSMFLFHVTHRTTNIFGKSKTVRESPYAYIPVSECKAWREEIEARAKDQGYITAEKIEDAKPDWVGDFMEWDSKWRKYLDRPKEPRNQELKIRLTAQELAAIRNVAEKLRFNSAEEFGTYLLAPIISGGFSGVSFIQSARRIVALIDEYEVGHLPMPRLLEFLRKNKK